MQEIGRGRCIITVISDKYLKSPNCMYELVQIAENGQFYDRIFPDRAAGRADLQSD